MILPPAVYLSVAFGGSYSSGREIAQFVASHGPWGGLLSLLAIAVTESAVLAVTFELARRYQQYEYRGFFRVLLGRAWFLFEIVVIIGMLLSLAVCASASGTVLSEQFGLPIWAGSATVLAFVVVLTYLGRAIVEASMVFSVTTLFLVLIFLLYTVIGREHAVIGEQFAQDTLKQTAWLSGAQYAIVTVAIAPLLLYSARGLRTRSEAILAGCATGTAAALPALAFHLVFMTQYPEIVAEPIPTYRIFEALGSPVALTFYVILVLVLISQTGVGMLQGLLERVDAWHAERHGMALNRTRHMLIASGMMGIAMLFASMGIIALIAFAFDFLALGFIVVYVIPALTYGVYLASRP